MIHGHKPAGYFVTATGEGLKIEGESRQCVHCQYHWAYAPGSGITRGYCLRCDGWLCARAECEREQALRRLQYPGYACMPFEHWVERQREDYARDSRYVVLPGGIVLVTDPDAPVRPATPQPRVPLIVVP